MQPAISLIITAYNREKYIGAAIESVIAQTRTDFELLIWDDGSIDNTVEIAKSYAKQDNRIKVIAAKHQGVGLSLKYAISRTNAPYLGWLDSDDLLAANALAETSYILDNKLDIGWVYTDYVDIDAEDNILSYGYRCLVPYNSQNILNQFMTFQFRLIRRNVFELAGGIDVNSIVEDYDLCIRLSEVAKVQHIFKPLYYYRTHPNSISWQRSYQQIQDSCKAVVKAQKRRKLWQHGIFSSITSTVLPLWLGFLPQIATAQITPANDGTGTIINQQGNVININGGSVSGDNANLFHSFSKFGLNANQTANFLSQPNIQNILGRVTGGNASIINGLIQVTGSNANLYLMNPAGIIFGTNSSLNVPASFTATTANGVQFGNQWFHAIGTNNYSSLWGNPTGFGFVNNQSGSILNAGNLTVNSGESLTLLGGTVINTGTISAPSGNVKIMAIAGDKIVRITPENSVLSLDLPLADKSQLSSQNSTIQQFSPLSLPQLLTGGNVQSATGVIVENGEVKLTSANTIVPTNTGTNIINGNVSVASTGNNSNGGRIEILGDKIALFDSNINASGIDGGQIFLGGDYQGQGTIPEATNIYINQNTIINANGINSNGGKVIVWADDTTRFFGKITATGINNSGFVETSGKNFLDVNGAIVNTGTWLLDPTNIEIVSSSSTTLPPSGIFDPPTTGNDSRIASSTIANALNNNTNVIITTASGSGGDGDISLNDSITATGTGTLTLTGRRFNINNPYGASININGALTFNINQVNPEGNPNTSSIQNAINAIGSVGSATINLAPGTYQGSTIDIDKNISIIGADLNNTILDGQNSNGIFEISGNGINVSLNNLNIKNGISVYAGGIYNGQTGNIINLNNVKLENNSSSSGGGIYNSGGIFSITNSTFNNNQSFVAGGAIYNDSGTVNILNSTFSLNTASFEGGAIVNNGTATMNINNSTFSDNTSLYGGAILNINNTSNLNIINSTFYNNTASDQGGAINNQSGNLNILYSTLNSNNATNQGGGIYNSFSGFALNNTIVAGNNSPDGADIFGNVSGVSFNNLIGNGTGITGIINGSNNNQIGDTATPINPKLAPLGDYGGVTQTMALLPDSPAINAGIANATITTDQRGTARGTAPDIGAFEVQGYTLTPVAGSGKNTTVGTNFNSPLQVLATENGFNKLVRGVNITFAAPLTGASGTFSGSATQRGITDTSGTASTSTIQANTIAGNYTIIASGVSNISGIVAPANFNLTNNPDVPNSITAISGTPQSTIVNTAFSNQLEAIVKDKYNNVIPNALVSFNVPVSGASAIISGTNNVNTNSSGIASIPVTANTVSGNYNVTANSSGIVAPANFSLTNNPDVPNSITAISGTPQSTIVNNNFSSPLQAVVKDKYGNVVPNALVSFNSPLFGASVSFVGLPSVNTDINGIASIPVTANTISGNYNVTANNGILTPANFSLTNNPDVPNSITAISGTPQSTIVNTAFSNQLEAIVKDKYNNVIPNALVSFNVPVSGASAIISGTNNVNTNSSGIASIPVTANTISGNYNVTASSSGIVAPANFSLTNNADVANSIIPIGGTPQATMIGTNFASQLQAIVQDKFGNPIPNVSVTFSAPNIGPSANFSSSQTVVSDNNGIVAIPVTANTIAGSYDVIANSGNSLPGKFTLLNNQNDNIVPEKLKPQKPTLPIIQPPRTSSTIEPLAKLDEKFTNDFTNYLSLPTNLDVITVNESRDILQKITNKTGVKPGLVYVSFIPKVATSQEQRILRSSTDVLEIVIVTQKGQTIRKVVDVNQKEVLGVAKKFRNAITDPRLLKTYSKPSKQLYDWLIKPIETELQEQKIDNLVFIMDEGLRTLPLAALYDGKQYLIEKYSVGLMPSLSLSDTSYVDIRKSQVLAMGLSTFIDQVTLLAVPTELETITKQLWTGKSLLNETVTLNNVQRQRQEIPYGIIHLATHGEFQSGDPSKSYIQLWDTRLQMNQLRQLGWNNPPVELVVLSACRTAVGDRDAELGFAGFAVQAGAKSALASLWYVSDEGTLGLMSEFYKQLRTSTINTKSEALRQAQLAMLRGEVRLENGKLLISRGNINLPPVLQELGDKDLEHPYFWSGFTMIGNPW